MKPQRSIRDDLLWALAVLVGFLIGALVFGVEWSVLAGAAVGVSLVVVVRLALRRHRAS